MTIQINLTKLVTAAVLAVVLSLSSDAAAQHVNREYGYNPDKIVIRSTIPDPQAVKRSPLTSDRLSTTSTRLIDARRGFRPYSSVHCGRTAQHRHRYAGYDDHFGISRPENRPWSYSQRTPRSHVSQFRNDSRQSTRSVSRTIEPTPAYTRLLPEQPREPEQKVDMKIRIHNDRTAIPTTTGAVLITADGTVIQVGD
jgi:hypothetical protein